MKFAISPVALMAVPVLFPEVSGRYLLTVPVFALVVFVFACEGAALSALLASPPLLAIGALSCSIYMVHMFIGQRLVVNAAELIEFATGWGLTSHVPPVGSPTRIGTSLWQGDLACVLYMAIVIGVEYLTYRYVEVPGRQWFRRFADRQWPSKSAGMPAPASAIEGASPAR